MKSLPEGPKWRPGGDFWTRGCFLRSGGSSESFFSLILVTFWIRWVPLAPPGVPPGLLPRVPPRGIPAPAPQSSPQGSPEDAPARGARFCARALPGYCFSGPLPPTAHAVAGFARAHTLRAPAIEMGTRSPTPARHSGRHPRGMRTLKTRTLSLPLSLLPCCNFHYHFHFLPLF